MPDRTPGEELKFREPVLGRSLRESVNAIIVSLHWEFQVFREHKPEDESKGSLLVPVYSPRDTRTKAIVGRPATRFHGGFVVAPSADDLFLNDRGEYRLIVVRPYDDPQFFAGTFGEASRDRHDISDTQREISLFVHRFRQVNGFLLI